MTDQFIRRLVGLFVEDEMLAVGVLVAVAIVALLSFVVPTWLTGLLLTVLLPAILATSVLRGVLRSFASPPAA